MGDLLGLGVVATLLFCVYALILGRGSRSRVGRPPSGIGTRFVDPTGAGMAPAVLTAFAAGSITQDLTGGTATLAAESGAALGLVVAVLLHFRSSQGVTMLALSGLGLVAALLTGVQFVAAPDDDGLQVTYRVALVGLVTLCFCLTALLFGRQSALRGGRGLALFGLVDVAVFLAGPGGASVISLSPSRHLAYLGTVCAFALFLGWAASELTLGLAAIGVGTTSFGLGLVGWAPGPHGFDQLFGVLAAVVVYALARAFLRVGIPAR